MSITYYDQKSGGLFRRMEWNPNGEYADNEYARVYFRIDTPSYRQKDRYEPGFRYFSDATGKSYSPDKDAWDKEIRDLFFSLGWTGKYAEFTKGKQHLYMHPDEVVGTVLKNEIHTIAEALEKNRLFSLRWVDVYEDVYDISDDEYLEMLREKKDRAKALILSSAKTAQRKLFYKSGAIVEAVGRAIHLPRVGLTDTSGYCPGDQKELAYLFTLDVIKELIILGYLDKFEREGELYIRTLNKTEQKKAKIDLEKFIADTLGGEAA